MRITFNFALVVDSRSQNVFRDLFFPVLPSRCVFPYYCPPGTALPLPCEGGYMAISSPGPRDSFEKFCRICDAGSYRNDSSISAPCQPCPAGFICPQGKCGCYGEVVQEIASVVTRKFCVGKALNPLRF